MDGQLILVSPVTWLEMQVPDVAKIQDSAEEEGRINGVNLYMNNMDDSWDGHHLQKELCLLGTITSTKVMMEHGSEQSQAPR
jgi:hypothetical protein